jgi:hypothetical protein
MCRQMAAIGAALLDRMTFDDRVAQLGLGILGGEASLHIIEREVQLVITDLL